MSIFLAPLLTAHPVPLRRRLCVSCVLPYGYNMLPCSSGQSVLSLRDPTDKPAGGFGQLIGNRVYTHYLEGYLMYTTWKAT